jgi:catechol 2,3-dioxygenase-like lactoylglutathione lyase family enzyme
MSTRTPAIRQTGHVCMAGSNIARALAFYTGCDGTPPCCAAFPGV